VKQVADGVWQLTTFGIPNLINAFVVEDVLIDSGTRHSRNLIMRQLQGHRINAHALTHAHGDHQGSSHELCEGLGIPYWVPERDADAAENPTLIGERQPDHLIARLYYKIFTGPGHPVARRLHEGDEVGGFSVLETPGHSAGHVVYWRESDGVLIAGDVVTNFDQLTLIPGLHEPKAYLSPDPV
jgi:hydroxyacylglutathione hydrolase